MKALIAILILVCVGLAAGLIYRHTMAERKSKQDDETIVRFETKAAEVEKKLEEQTKVNSVLEENLNARTKELTEVSNTLVTVTANLAKVREEAQIAATNAAADLAKRDARINELETQRDDLTKRMTDLNGQMSDYQGRIEDIQRKLVASEGDRDYLLKELKRLQTEKIDLERQFNDLAMVRDQVRKLKDELSISRRLDWIRRGLYGSLKGAERLQKGFTAPSTNRQNYDLNVELTRTGDVQIVPKDTNAPPATIDTNNTPVPQ